MSDAWMRNLCLLQALPRRPSKLSVTALQEKLAEHGFHVTVRTVQRDLKTLSRHLPLSSDEPAKPAGWSWSGREPLRIPALDPAGALALVLANRYLESLLPPAVRSHIETEASAARRLLDGLGSSGLGQWTDKVRVLPRGPRLRAPAVDPMAAVRIYEAVLDGKRLDAAYRPVDAERARRYEVNPLGLVARDGAVYVVATLGENADVRQLALHRFGEVTLLDRAVEVPDGFSLDDYIASGAFEYPLGSGRSIRLVLELDDFLARHLSERPLSDDQRITPLREGGTRLHATVQDTGELRWWILSFGAYVEVRAPASLRRAIGQVAREMAALYDEG